VGRIVVVGRLAIRDLARHRAEAVMLLLAIVAAMSTLTLGLLVHGGTSPTYRTTRRETAGPDVVATSASSGPGHSTTPADLAALTKLIGAPGVIAHTGPYPVAWATLRAHGVSAGVMAEGRDAAPASIDQPKVIQGGWVRGGGVVVEQAFAEAVGVRTGDRVTLNGRPFQVAGIAVTAAIPPYPNAAWSTQRSPFVNPGLVWLTQADAEAVATRALPPFCILNLKLANPAGAWSFGPAPTASPTAPLVMPWQEIEQEDVQVLLVEQRDLLTGSWLLALLAIASLAVLVGGQMAEQTRRVGLLKAVGGTPGFVSAVLLAEYMLLALVAAAAGLATGWLTAPLLSRPGAGLLGSAGAPTLELPTAGVVVGVALAVTLIATLRPVRRAARTSTVSALADTALPPRRRAWLIALSAHLPPPLLIGMRVASRRPRRIVLTMATVAITVSGIVAVMIAHATNAQHLGAVSPLNNPRTDRLNEVMLVITIMAIILATVNILFVAWATVQDSRHSSAVTRALGATPAQVTGGLSAAQVLPALAGAIFGLPGGIGLYASVSHAAATPPLWWLITLVLGTVVLVAGLTSVPARLGSRRPAGEILQSEVA
jgi:ABC-type lipoprotein release transport system permease subunit